MSAEATDELGPVDFVLVEWRDRQPDGRAAPHLVDLVDRGTIRILDLAFLTKSEAGDVAAIETKDVEAIEGLADLVGASSGLLGDDDIQEAGNALEPGTSAALLVYENAWAAPFAAALRENGAQLVANGRVPVQALLAAVEAEEA